MCSRYDAVVFIWKGRTCIERILETRVSSVDSDWLVYSLWWRLPRGTEPCGTLYKDQVHQPSGVLGHPDDMYALSSFFLLIPAVLAAQVRALYSTHRSLLTLYYRRRNLSPPRRAL